jgi:chromosome segregation ATPase
MYEAKALGEMLEKKKKEAPLPPAREIRKNIHRLEFIISTEARTLKQERELVKEVRVWERKLDGAVELERMERRLVFINEDMQRAEQQVKELETRMNELRTQVHEKHSEEHKSRKESKLLELKRKVEEEKLKELEPFMKKSEDGRVDLGEICVIKKKEK